MYNDEENEEGHKLNLPFEDLDYEKPERSKSQIHILIDNELENEK